MLTDAMKFRKDVSLFIHMSGICTEAWMTKELHLASRMVWLSHSVMAVLWTAEPFAWHFRNPRVSVVVNRHTQYFLFSLDI